MGAGIAALMGLLNGGGQGLYKGVDAGIADELNQAKLAEQKRQFDESKVTDLSALSALVPQLAGVGKVPTAVAPALVTEAQKLRAEQVAAAKNRDLGAALENNNFGPRAAETPISAQAPGMLAPDARTPDPTIAALGPLARAGEPDKSMAALNEILKIKAVNDRAAQQPYQTPGVQMDTLHSPNPLAIENRVATNGMTLSHTRPIRPGELMDAHTAYLEGLQQKAAMGAPLTPQEQANWAKSAAFINARHPLLQAADQTPVARGGYGLTPPGAPAAPAPAPAPNAGDASFSQFQADMRKGGASDGDITAAWDSLRRGGPTQVDILPTGQQGQAKPPADVFTPPSGKGAYKGPYQVFAPPAPPQVPGQIGQRIPARAPAQEVDKIRDQEFAINSMRNIADALEATGMDDKERLRAAFKLGIPGALEHIPVLGSTLSKASQASSKIALPPDMAAIQTHIGHAQLRYENAMGGVRAAGSPQMYPIFQGIIGNLADVNAPAKLRALADDLQTAALIGQQKMVESRYQGIPLHLRPVGGGAARPPLSSFER